MLTFTHRARANANASLISMVQRFSDITILFVSLYIVCAYNELTFDYKYSLLALAVLVVFQMIGGITDFLQIVARSENISGINTDNQELDFEFTFHSWFVFFCT